MNNIERALLRAERFRRHHERQVADEMNRREKMSRIEVDILLIFAAVVSIVVFIGWVTS